MATIYDKGIAYKHSNGDIWYRNFPDNAESAKEPLLPGEPGYGTGVYSGDDLEDTLGLIPMEGCDNSHSDNYGNYQNADGSVFCFIPKFYYSFDCKTTDAHYQDVLTYSKLTAEQVAEIVRRSPQNYMVFAPGSAFVNEAEANEHGFILHRAFIDGTEEKTGFFIAKYLASRGTDGNSTKALFVKNGQTISLTSNSNYVPSSEMSGNCDGTLKDAIRLSKAINSNLNCASAFMYSALAMQSKFIGSIVTNTSQCAWYDSNLTTNYPKGCNNSNLGDIDDSSVKYIEQYNKKPLTGSATSFAKTTHNGLNNGVCDLNGCVYQVVTCVGWDGTRILKDNYKLINITTNNVDNRSASIYDTYSGYSDDQNLNYYWGNEASSSWRKAISGSSRALEGIYPISLSVGCSTSGTNEFGTDLCHASTITSLSALYCSGYMYEGINAGIFRRDGNNWDKEDSYASFRAGGYAS